MRHCKKKFTIPKKLKFGRNQNRWNQSWRRPLNLLVRLVKYSWSKQWRKFENLHLCFMGKGKEDLCKLHFSLTQFSISALLPYLIPTYLKFPNSILPNDQFLLVFTSFLTIFDFRKSILYAYYMFLVCMLDCWFFENEKNVNKVIRRLFIYNIW